jgi:hypothetical protein
MMAVMPVWLKAGAAAALKSPFGEFAVCIQEWQRRRDVVLEQLN